jgi:hypothetical protein
MILGTVEIMILTSALNLFGDVVATVEFKDNAGKSSTLHYLVAGCEHPSYRWIFRSNLGTTWTINGPKVADKIATELCQSHYTMGGI